MAHIMCKIGEYAIIAENEKFLAIQIPGSGLWMLPGGRMEDTDEPSGCVVRELKEELNLDIEVIRPVHVARWGIEQPAKYTVFFLCKAINLQDIKPLPAEVLQYKWMTLVEAEELNWLNRHFLDAVRKAME